jgi:signal recognition particle subunit SRP54
MFDQLSDKLDGVLSAFRQRGVLTEPMIREGLREIRRVLLEADVNYQVTRDFLKRVEEKALGERVLKAVSPGQQIVKIVHEELTAMLGEKRIAAGAGAGPADGDHDGGAAGLGEDDDGGQARAQDEARDAADAAGRLRRVPAGRGRPAADAGRAGRRAGLRGAGEHGRGRDRAARAGVGARERDRVVIFDTAGRLQIDEEMMDELKRLKASVEADTRSSSSPTA